MFEGGFGSSFARAGVNKMDKVLRTMKAKMIRVVFGFFISNPILKANLRLGRWCGLAARAIAGWEYPALAVRRDVNSRSVTHGDHL